MADLFKALKPKQTHSKNGFDLSRKHVFSSQPGLCEPCLCVETVPDDYFEIDLASLTRTRTMNTAAFLRGKQRFDFFFVPYTQLWHPFNQFISQRTDKHSTTQLGHIYAPVVQLSEVIQYILFLKKDTVNYRDYFGFPLWQNTIRLLDMLGYGDFRWLSQISDQADEELAIDAYKDKYVNIFRLLAYQHIWYDYYRNKYYDVDNTGGIQPPFAPDQVTRDYVSSFNVDDIDCTSFANSVLSLNLGRFGMIFKLNYIQWKKDLYTTAMPSQQFGAVSSVDLSGNLFSAGVGNIPTDTTVSPVPNSNLYTLYSQAFGGSVGDATVSIPSAFDVLSLRKAEALQQWKQNTLRAGNMTDDSFRAHYGVEPYYSSDENVRYLGSFSSALQVNAVETTANSSESGNNVVGDLAATGTIVANGNKLKFDVKDFGIIMCISSFLPESEYSSNALDKANTLHEQFDWFTPEFQNIGLEAVTHKEVDWAIQDTDLNGVIGYAPRYYMYKTAVDKVFGEFKDSESMLYQTLRLGVQGDYEAWVAPRVELSSNFNRLIATFYVDPRVYDNVFAVNYDGSQRTDAFLHNVFFDIKALRPMSVLGLPQF